LFCTNDRRRRERRRFDHLDHLHRFHTCLKLRLGRRRRRKRELDRKRRRLGRSQFIAKQLFDVELLFLLHYRQALRLCCRRLAVSRPAVVWSSVCHH